MMNVHAPTARVERGIVPGTHYGEYGAPRAVGVSTAPRLGGAWAGSKWQWAPLAGGMEQALLRLMRAAAWSTGRSEAELWVEAAREWLARRALDDEPQPPTPAAAALAVPRPSSAWAAIDTLLADLRLASGSDALAAQSAA